MNNHSITDLNFNSKTITLKVDAVHTCGDYDTKFSYNANETRKKAQAMEVLFNHFRTIDSKMTQEVSIKVQDLQDKQKRLLVDMKHLIEEIEGKSLANAVTHYEERLVDTDERIERAGKHLGGQWNSKRIEGYQATRADYVVKLEAAKDELASFTRKVGS